MEELLCQALKHEISPLPSRCDTVVLQRPRMLDNQGGRVQLQAVRNGCFSDYQPIALHKLAEQDSQPFNSDKLGSPVTIQVYLCFLGAACECQAAVSSDLHM